MKINRKIVILTIFPAKSGCDSINFFDFQHNILHAEFRIHITEFVQLNNYSKLETDRYHFLEPLPIFKKPNVGGLILSDISYHCKIRIRISASIQKVKHRPIISVGR